MQLMTNDALKSAYIERHSIKSYFSVVVFVCLFTLIIFTALFILFIHLTSVLQWRATVKTEGERGGHAQKLMNQTQSCDFITLWVLAC